MKKANEPKMVFNRIYCKKTDEEEYYEDKKLFIENLAWLISQTANDVHNLRLKDKNTVTFELTDYMIRDIDITDCEYAEILRRVAAVI